MRLGNAHGLARRARFGLLAIALALVFGTGLAQGGPKFQPGAPGIGDPYFPLDGNGGYDAKHYLLELTYDPATDVLDSKATVTARATQNLSRFNLDFVGLTVDSIKVDGHAATWKRDGGELTVVPRSGLPKGDTFVTVVRYHGVPEPVVDALGVSGFLTTDDGAVVAGQPHVAATWYPVNDHPLDKGAYTFHIRVPAGLEAVANGKLESKRTAGGWTTWKWNAKEPMASYLATMAIGQFDIHAYRIGGLPTWDAIDPQLFDVPSPRTGDQYAISQKGDPSYKRLMHTISVPAGGATLSFAINRDTEPGWDFAFVEAHTLGKTDWTTLRDLNGHTSRSTGFSCPSWHELHPFLTHYQTEKKDGTCSPEGSTGKWWAVSGESDGWETWKVDLSSFAGSTVRVSISYASDDFIQLAGVFVDDVVVSTGQGTTSFEDDGNTSDGWTVPGSPAGSAPNPTDWIFGTRADAPPAIGADIEASFARQGEILAFLSKKFGPYPFSTTGGIVDDVDLGFALETQTRPVYDKVFWTAPGFGDSVVVHELTHQWYGDSLALAAWQHIWLNEGFATYAEWLWAAHEGIATVRESFDDAYSTPADDPFWSLVIGDPGPDDLFDDPVYTRGAMTLQQLRLTVGDDDFFKILRRWAANRAGGNVTTDQFIALAERISGKNLDKLFQAWLFTPGKPALPGSSSVARTGTAGTGRMLLDRVGAARR
ncbi:MAG TPA: M1 family aminopeptidase [Gaiellaceae bacterium]